MSFNLSNFPLGTALVVVGLLGNASCGSVTDQKENAPTIAAVSPDHGSAVGGIKVTITGTNFQAEPGDPLVIVNGSLATDAVATSDTEMTFTLPAAAPGADATKVDVSLATQSGFAKAPQAFRYHALPRALEITPAVGRSVGGTPIKIVGTGFLKDDAGTPTVEVDGVAAAEVQVVDDNTITARTAPAAPNSPAFTPVPVRIKTANGVAALDNTFRLSKPGLLAVERSSDERSRIFFIDTETKQTVVLATAQRRLIGCATSPGGEVFSTAGRNGTTQQLVVVSPTDGTVTTKGGLKTTDNNTHRIGAMTFVGNTLYGTATGQSIAPLNRLVSINPSSGSLTPIGGAQTMNPGNAIAPKDATSIYYTTATDAMLNGASISTSVLAPGPVLNGASLPNRTQGMALVGSTLFVGDRPGSQTNSGVYTVNTTTGKLTIFVTMPGQISGLCPSPSTF
jgi:hypothetical protein